MKSVKKILGIILAFVCCFGILGCGNSANGEGKPQKYVMSQAATVNALSATDAYGRSFSPVKSMNSSKKVGIFYFVWMGNHGSAYIDNSKTDLDVLKSSSDMNVHHYWGEPLYGYYHSEDPWVIYKHIELFIMAGIDYICLDTTNGVYFSASQDYRKAIDTVLDVLLKFRTRGFNVPQVMFYTNTKSGENVQFLYDNYYNTEKKPRVAKYEPLWFKFEGMPHRNMDTPLYRRIIMRFENDNGTLRFYHQGEQGLIEAWGQDSLRVRTRINSRFTGNNWALTEPRYNVIPRSPLPKKIIGSETAPST